MICWWRIGDVFLAACQCLWDKEDGAVALHPAVQMPDPVTKWNMHKYKYKYTPRWQNEKIEHAQIQKQIQIHITMTKWQSGTCTITKKKHKYISICPIQGQMWDKWCTAGTNMLVRMVQKLQCQMTGFPILRKCYVTGMNVVMADYWTSWFVDEQDCLFKMIFGCLLMRILSWTAFGRLVNYGNSGLVDEHTRYPKKV